MDLAPPLDESTDDRRPVAPCRHAVAHDDLPDAEPPDHVRRSVVATAPGQRRAEDDLEVDVRVREQAPERPPAASALSETASRSRASSPSGVWTRCGPRSSRSCRWHRTPALCTSAPAALGGPSPGCPPGFRPRGAATPRRRGRRAAAPRRQHRRRRGRAGPRRPRRRRLGLRRPPAARSRRRSPSPPRPRQAVTTSRSAHRWRTLIAQRRRRRSLARRRRHALPRPCQSTTT